MSTKSIRASHNTNGGLNAVDLNAGDVIESDLKWIIYIELKIICMYLK